MDSNCFALLGNQTSGEPIVFNGWGNHGNALKLGKRSWEGAHLGGHRVESEYLMGHLPALCRKLKAGEGVLNQ